MSATDTNRPDTQHLRETLQRKFPGASATAADWEQRVFRSGLQSLDNLFSGGGIPWGQLIEITGGLSSGKTSLTLKLLAGLIDDGTAVYADFSRTFFPAAAVTAGVDIDNLWVIRPSDVPTGLRTVELLLSRHLVRGVVLDLAGIKDGPALSSTLLHRLRQQAARSGAIVIFLTDFDHSRKLITPSTVSLRLEIERVADRRITMSVTKSRLCREGIKREMTL